MSEKKATKKSDRAIIALVAKEMAQPRKTQSVRNDEIETGKKKKHTR